jgi:hypothetical protein
MDARKQAWARLLAKVYEIDTLVCPKCGSEMKVIAVIQDPVEIRDILAHLVKTGRKAGLPASTAPTKSATSPCGSMARAKYGCAVFRRFIGHGETYSEVGHRLSGRRITVTTNDAQ